MAEPGLRLYLVQHGDALTEDVDPERRLSDQGRADITRLVAWLVTNDVAVSRICHSGKTRARQTAELLGPVLEAGGEILPAEGLGPNDPPEVFLQQLQNVDEDTLIASHLPFVARVLSQAITGSPDQQLVQFRPGSIAVVERDKSGPWHLICFACPDFF
ncbi:MAG: phosphohistidine phosphatase SixA [Gammaproteobacteria bacterium]|nr:MAG: phosphohistidine phosphatase SixA [Gammaproteobacteria bacterium]